MHEHTFNLLSTCALAVHFQTSMHEKHDYNIYPIHCFVKEHKHVFVYVVCISVLTRIYRRKDTNIIP